MDILVSFCGVSVPGMPLLGIVSHDLQSFRILPLLDDRNTTTQGITGLAACENYLYAAVQDPAREAAILSLSLDDLSLVHKSAVPMAGDLHSIWAEKDCLFTVSTATDEVYRLRIFDGAVVDEEVVWRPEADGDRIDRYHLNSVCRWQGDLLVSGFGQRSRETWKSADNGFIYNITRGTTICSGIRHPHSLAPIDGQLAFCESRERKIRFLNSSRERVLAGYTRGLCQTGADVYVGSSRGRRVSKSREHASLDESDRAHCAITRLRGEHLAPEGSIDLSDFAMEIYDLMPVSSVAKWPSVAAEDFGAVDVAWWQQTQQLLEELAAISAPGDGIILLDQEQLGVGKSFFGRSCRAFPQWDGRYCGPPDDDEGAISALDVLRQEATLLVIAWPAFWWLDHYSGFQRHLHSHYRCVLQNERAVAFAL